jgi:hypothetical protein
MSIEAVEGVIVEEHARPRPARASAARRAWTLLFLYGALLGLSSLFALVQGRLFDHGFADAVTSGSWTHAAALLPNVDKSLSAMARLLGATGIVAAILTMAVAATAYRRGERWAWYVMWALPVHATIDFATLLGYDALSVISATWDVALLVIALLGLFVPYGVFFPNEVRRATGSRRPVRIGPDDAPELPRPPDTAPEPGAAPDPRRELPRSPHPAPERPTRPTPPMKRTPLPPVPPRPDAPVRV